MLYPRQDFQPYLPIVIVYRGQLSDLLNSICYIDLEFLAAIADVTQNYLGICPEYFLVKVF